MVLFIYYLYIYFTHVTFYSPTLYIFTLPSDNNSSHLYVLSSKFNWKPVFKSQINRAFLPTTPKRASRFFTAGLYLAYDHFVILHFNFYI